MEHVAEDRNKQIWGISEMNDDDECGRRIDERAIYVGSEAVSADTPITWDDMCGGWLLFAPPIMTIDG